jgi:molybdopterin-binding protein
LASVDDLLTAQQAADLLHLHVKRVQGLARAGKLPALRHGRKWLFPRARLLEALEGAGEEPSARADRAVAPTPARRSAGVDISARNQLQGRVTQVRADGVMAEVHLRIGDQELVSIITRDSAERLGLHPGLDVLAVVKSTEVMIARPVGE